MFGTTDSPPQQSPQLVAETVKPKDRRKEKPPAVNTVKPSREKTSFAIRPDVKRQLTVLKLDLRAAGYRVTEAEIVETLIAQADVGTLASLFRARSQ
jgi:hypothetical protein